MFLFLSYSVSLGVSVRATAVSGGEEHSMVVDENGMAWSCGGSTLGHSGNPSNFNLVVGGEMSTPSGYLENIADVAAGWLHSLVLDNDKNVWAWGSNGSGQLGNGTYDTSTTPVQVKAGDQNPVDPNAVLQDIIAIAAGRSGTHSLAVEDDTGFVYAWGSNDFGQLGINNQQSKNEPNLVLGGDMGTSFLQDIIAVSAGAYHSMALADDGSVYCFGSNTHGMLGINDTQIFNETVPQLVHDVNSISGYLENICAISAGWFHSMALEAFDIMIFLDAEASTGRVYTWGNNGAGWGDYGCGGGRLGDGTTTNRPAPVLVHKGEQDSATDYLENITAISAGESHCLALDYLGRVLAWGDNTYGQLGTGDTVSSTTPVYVRAGWQNPADPNTPLSNIVAVSAGYWHNLAIDEDGVVWVWGNYYNGKLGLGGIYDNVLYPEPVELIIPPVRNITQGKSYQQIQPAVNEAQNGDTIVVDEGIYYEHLNIGGKRITLRSTDPDNPAVVANTIIDGDSEDSQDIITIAYNWPDGDQVCTIRGLTLRNTGTSASGVYCDYAAPVITRCILDNCYRGVYAVNSSALTIEDCVVQNSGYIGVSVISSSSASLTNCIIRDSAIYGVYGGTDTIVDLYACTVSENGQDGVWTYKNLEIENCIIENNTGSGVYGYTGSGTINITSSAIRNNTGRGVYTLDKSLTIAASLIADNGNDGIYGKNCTLGKVANSVIRKNSGHGVYLETTRWPTILNNWIVDNHGTSGRGWGVYLIEPTSGYSVQLRNNTISQNYYGGIYRNDGQTPTILNSIVWNNGGQSIAGGATVTYSCVSGGYAGTGNISTDPDFAAPQDGNFHISADSPCANAGNTVAAHWSETDIDDQERVFNGTVDMGADEYHSSPGDFDADGMVNFQDYAWLAAAWQTSIGQANWNAVCDLSADETVDEEDLLLFVDNWLWQSAQDRSLFEDEDIEVKYGAMLDLGNESLMMAMAAKIQVLTVDTHAKSTPTDPAAIWRLIDWLDEMWKSGELAESITLETYGNFRIVLERLMYQD